MSGFLYLYRTYPHPHRQSMFYDGLGYFAVLTGKDHRRKITFSINDCVAVTNIVNIIFYLRSRPALQVRDFVYFFAHTNPDLLTVFSVSRQQMPVSTKQVELLHSQVQLRVQSGLDNEPAHSYSSPRCVSFSFGCHWVFF